MLDLEHNKRFNQISALKYIGGHQGALANMLNDRVRKQDHNFVTREMLKKGVVLLAYILERNYADSMEDERIEKVYKILADEGMFTLLLGAKRHGKTASAIAFAEWLIENGYSVYWFGLYSKLKDVYPEIKQTLDIKRIENAILIVDEVILMWFGREAMMRELRERVKSLPTAGHRGLSILWLSQSTRIDALIKDLIDFVWFKPLFSFEFFETGVKVNPVIKYVLPTKKQENLILNVQTQETYIFNNSLPNRWCPELSKPYSLIKGIEEAKEFFEECLKVFSQREAIFMLEQRGWSVDDIFPSEEGEGELFIRPARDKVGYPSADNKTQPSQSGSPSSEKLIKCPHCKSFNYQRHGSYKDKIRYRCLDCWKTWSR